MKKVFVMLIIFVLSFSVAACGGGANDTSQNQKDNQSMESNQTETPTDPEQSDELVPEEGAQLVVWESGGGIGEWTKYAAEEFTKKYNVPVTFEEVGHTDAPAKMATDGPAGVGADVFAAPHDHLGEMVASGLVLENSFADEYKKDFLKATIDGTSIDGVLYGYPTSIETYGLFYNKDLVKELPETWDQLLEQAKGLTDVKQNKFGFMWEVNNFYFAFAFMGGYGGYVFGNNNTDPQDLGLNNEGSIKAAQLFQRMHEEVLPIKAEDITYDIKQSLFNEGKLAFNMDGPWAVSGHRDAGINFGVMPLPKLDNGQAPTSFSGIRAFYVNSYTKYPNAAELFARFVTSEEMLLKRFEMTGQLPSRTALLENPTIKNDEIASAFLQQAQYSVPMPSIPEMQSVWDPMKAALTTIWNSNTDPKQVLDSTVQQIKDAIATK